MVIFTHVKKYTVSLPRGSGHSELPTNGGLAEERLEAKIEV